MPGGPGPHRHPLPALPGATVAGAAYAPRPCLRTPHQAHPRVSRPTRCCIARQSRQDKDGSRSPLRAAHTRHRALEERKRATANTAVRITSRIKDTLRQIDTASLYPYAPRAPCCLAQRPSPVDAQTRRSMTVRAERLARDGRRVRWRSNCLALRFAFGLSGRRAERVRRGSCFSTTKAGGPSSPQARLRFAGSRQGDPDEVDPDAAGEGYDDRP